MNIQSETPKRLRSSVSSARARYVLSLLIAAGLLYTPTRALADRDAPPERESVETETQDPAENPAEDPAEDPAEGPVPEKALSYFDKAAEAEEEGRQVAAADLYEAGYALLDDPRKYRTPRSTAISKLYNSLITAYEKTDSKASRLHRACRLRKLMTRHLNELRAAYGEASESFPEVYIGSEKLQNLDAIIGSYGDPNELCPTEENEYAKVAMLDPKSAFSFSPPEETGSSAESSALQNSSTDDTPIAPARDRKAVAMTAVGGSAIGVGAIALGVMTAYIVQSAQRSADIDNLREETALRGPNLVLTAEEIAYGDRLNREGLLANKVAIGTGIGGGALLATGAILTAIGRKRMRSSELSVVPNASRTSLGATLSIRF